MKSASCAGTTVLPSILLGCDTWTSKCVPLPWNQSEQVDCADEGLACEFGQCVDENPDKCVPGQTFPADDLCNSCLCPESGLVSDAQCTNAICADCYSDKHCGEGFTCVNGGCITKDCSTDQDCPGSTTPGYCFSSTAYPEQVAKCDAATNKCIKVYNGPIISCGSTGLQCEDAKCVPADGCKTSADCGTGATPPYCDGDIAVDSSYPACDADTGQCITAGGGTTDCAALGLTCDFGSCVAP